MKDPGHGVFDLLDALEQLDGKTVRLNAEGTSTATPQSKADFDRQVRESMDRLHRRQVIAGG